ncbi:helix-turn-helix transcriptional regulator [Pandoraea sputorum]|uniref:helix-turn-helix transcriptional regulator n=1 Tax=Pandoraea sputorum TaxID=93222 RepID=UPI0012413179|nr:helix-turn-helix transcriptional regulator [Pandoraea sputorum]VVE56495.1 transcriptional regulator [Pandoraea sputorum]
MTTAAALGREIKRVRMARKMSAQALSTKAAVNRITLRELEAGTGNPRLSTLLAVCHALELDLTVLPQGLGAVVREDQNLRTGALRRLLATRAPPAENDEE